MSATSPVAFETTEVLSIFPREERIVGWINRVSSDLRVVAKAVANLPSWLHGEHSYGIASQGYAEPDCHVFSQATWFPPGENELEGLDYEATPEDIAGRMALTRKLIACQLLNINPDVMEEPGHKERVEKMARRVMLLPSGTDPAAVHSALHQEATALIAMEEMGSGTLAAITKGLLPDTKIHKDLPAVAGMRQITGMSFYQSSFRSGDGRLKPIKEVLDSVKNWFRRYRENDQKTIIHIPFPPKTGMVSKDLFSYLKELIKQGTNPPPVFDLAQMRPLGSVEMRREIYAYLEAGRADAVLSLSKYLSFPPFVGALIMSDSSLENLKNQQLATSMLNQGWLKAGYLEPGLAPEMGLKNDRLEPDNEMDLRLQLGLRNYAEYLRIDPVKRLDIEQKLIEDLRQSCRQNLRINPNRPVNGLVHWDEANDDGTPSMLTLLVTPKKEPKQFAKLIKAAMAGALEAADSFILSNPVSYEYIETPLQDNPGYGGVVIRIALSARQVVAAVKDPEFRKKLAASEDRLMKKLSKVLGLG